MPTTQELKKLRSVVKQGYPTALIQHKSELTIADATQFIDMLVTKSGKALSEKDVTDYLKDIKGYTGDIGKLQKIKKLLSEFSIDGKFRIMRSHGKDFVIFSGYPGKRKLFSGTRYAATNPKIVDMVITKTGILKDALKGSLLTLIIYVPLNLVKTFMQDAPTIGYFLGVMATDFIKVGTSAAFSAGVTSLLVASTGLLVLPIAAGLVVGIAVGMLLNEVDNRYQITKRLIEYLEENIDRSLSRFLWELERNIKWRITRQLPF